MAHYAAAKAGVIGFTRSLAYEVARDGITVNAICPGPVDTELFRNIPEDWRRRKLAELPIGRAGRVDEIAPAAVLLASDEGSYFIGASINPKTPVRDDPGFVSAAGLARLPTAPRSNPAGYGALGEPTSTGARSL